MTIAKCTHSKATITLCIHRVPGRKDLAEQRDPDLEMALKLIRQANQLRRPLLHAARLRSF